MFASSRGSRSKRRGIVLILVLGMLGLMALIGVTFATFAGQSLINSRNFAQGVARPQAEVLMDYALAQLINDTNNPLSAIRGHSLLRDMYGNDSVFRGNNPSANPAAETGGILSSVVYPNGSSSTLHLTAYQLHPTGTDTPFYNQLQYATNIPTGGQYYGLDFTRWIIRFPGNVSQFPYTTVPQTFEILEDDPSGSFHLFTLSNNLANPTNDPTYGVSNPPLSASDWTSFIYNDPNMGAPVTPGNTPSVNKPYTNLAHELNTVGSTAGSLSNTAVSNPFVLDGRYMRAFNGPGLTRLDQTSTTIYPYNFAAYGNFRLSGLDPDAIGMDEDYDACDLENWYLAIQSADGQVVIPSFHRPGILTAADWTTNKGVGNTKILRPRQADNSPLFPADPSIPDVHGKLTYDVDNDGDGVTDSVWLDLGYPVQRDPGGKMYKPLFAFMVLGLNGRLPLNTVGNLQARAIGDQALNATHLTYYNSTTGTPGSTAQVAYPGSYADNSGTTGFHPLYSSETYLDAPLWDHASHLGFSVNEINPKFALQNAPSNVYPSTNPTATGGTAINANATHYSQLDNAGVGVALTQLRNILTGTKPTDFPYPSTPTAATVQNNADANVVAVDGLNMVLPNNVYDAGDFPNSGFVTRTTTAVPGRWGESQGVPSVLDAPGTVPYNGLNFPILHFNNMVRAGRSIYTSGTTYNLTNDALDDDFDSTDPYLPSPQQNATNSFSVVPNLGTLPSSAAGNNLELPLVFTSSSTAPAYSFTRSFPEAVDFIDNAGQFGIATERIRRYVTPQDPAGVGRLVSYMNRPNNDHDYGTGADARGRLGYFRYFRPAGTPQEVRYPYTNDTTVPNSFPYPYVTGSGTGQQYLMPILIPAGYASTTPLNSANPTAIAPASRSDKFNNDYHGFQSMATPAYTTPKVNAQTIAAMGAMPRDWDLAIPGVPVGDQTTTPTPVTVWAPTINPNSSTILTNVNSENGPNLGATGNGGNNNIYPILYGATYSATNQPANAPVVNGYLGGSLNKDEADEMNLYVKNHFDMPFGPSDLEWLYRKQDVDGSTLSSRLSQLAPVSFNNPADGLTRRRMFSTDAFDLISFAYANDNPGQYAGAYYGASSDHNFTYNSRFAPNASPSLELMNQVVVNTTTDNTGLFITPNAYANFITTMFLPNPTLPPQSLALNSINTYIPNSAYSSTNPVNLPLTLNTGATTVAELFKNTITNAQINPTNRLIVPFGGKSNGVPLSSVQVQTPSVAHRDRKINLNYPLPVSNDPAEPIRQKWCRETYQMLKAILPPASVDTPEELAQLSQFVVNIIDFRDPDCTMTRFVNTDLEVTDNLTHTAVNQQTATPDLTWTVSVPGVKFTTTPLPNNPFLNSPHFPYDPSIYNPDGDLAGNPTPFLVQHGMEYNPIAITEAMAYQAQYGLAPNAPMTYSAMFIELVNTLTEEQNNPSATGAPNLNNSSAINLAGWDIVIAPDSYGWGRPDPNSGEVNPVAWPLWIPNTGGTVGTPPAATQRPHTTPPPTDPNLIIQQTSVQQYSFVNGASQPIIPAMNSGTPGSVPYYFVVGDYRTGTGPTTASVLGSTVEQNPVANPTLDVQLPTSFVFPTPPTGSGTYYWVYLRRPANPFDTAPPDQVRPNKEMVVVDAMRFPVVDAGTAGGTPPAVTASTGQVYSAERLQPYRGGHLVRVDTAPPSGLPTSGAAAGAKTICPPSPAYAYGYSEQMAEPKAGATVSNGIYKLNPTDTTGLPTTLAYKQSINSRTPNPNDTPWSPFPFHDRDFASVAELLLVPGCPPGLFTKQFVEEKYPGNIFDAANNLATGTDARDFATPVVSPTASGQPTSNPSQVARVNFHAVGTEIPSPSYPYLVDNFYYTAASVAPPAPPAGASTSYSANYTHLTTEIGGWTGAGWHKMLEFFEVPSSANGAIGTADGGNNYDWARADTKPGQLNINLIIDEEVFAGLVDDPRLNEALAAATSMIPYVVSQIDTTGYPAQDANGNIIGRSPIFNQPSSNLGAGGTPFPPLTPNPNYGRGYVYRDPNSDNYPVNTPASYNYQQLHGIKAAFSDFLKLRHGGSGYIFGYGAGPTGSGDFTLGPVNFSATSPSPPLAAERPYRSLSYPDINYTILRPASLPPSPVDGQNPVRYTASTPPLPSPNDNPFKGSLFRMFQYQPDATGIFPYVGLSTYLAPMNNAIDSTETSPGNFPYTQDPGIKNPYLPIQFANKTSPLNTPTPGTPPPAPMPPGPRYLGPPYAAVPDPRPTAPTVIPSAPFPPPIPPTPARRLFQIPDVDQSAVATGGLTTGYSSNASLFSQYDIATHIRVNTAIAAGTQANVDDLAREYTIDKPTITLQLSTLPGENYQADQAPSPGFSPLSTSTVVHAAPPSLVDQTRAIFLADNYTPQQIFAANNYLGAPYDNAAHSPALPTDYRMHPVYRTEWLQKISNLTTVRTHQYAVWITVGFFEVVQTGTPELGVPDAIGQELGLTAGKNVRYRSFFVIDRTKATGFNPYFPGNFRDCLSYRRRIE